MATASENLLGTQGQSRAFSRFGPQFQGQNDEIIRNLLTRLGGQAQQGFEPIENQARRDFEQKTLPTIGERFTSLGSNALSSPAYQSQKYGSAIDLETNLAALKSQYGLQQNNQLMQLLQLLSPEQAYFQGQPGLLEGGAKGLAEGLPSYLSSLNLGKKQESGDENQGTNWLDVSGNALLGLAPAGAAFGPAGVAAGAGAGLIGALLKYLGGRKSSNSVDATSSPIQQQLMNQKPSNYNSQYNDLSFKGPGGQGSPLGALDFSMKSPGLNRIGALG